MAVHYSQFQQQQQMQFRMASALAGARAPSPNHPAMLFPQTVAPPPHVFSEPVSELTCNISGSRKRAREDEPLMQATTTADSALLMYQQQLMLPKQYQQLLILQNQIQLCKPQPDAVIDNTRICQSITTSTSGRPTATPYTTSGLSSPTSTLISLFNQQGLEVDDLIRNLTDNLSSALLDAHKRQCRVVISSVARQAQARIAKKQAEVEAAEKRNANLQELLRKAFSESQAWFNVARNSEAVIASLRDSLEQALLQNLSEGGEGLGVNKTLDEQVEGYGDSGEEAISAASGTAASSAAGVPCPGQFTEVSKPALVAVVEKNPTTTAGICFTRCKSCGASEGSVIVLPCRHLCLCQACEPTVVECPVCHGRKNGSFQINLS